MDVFSLIQQQIFIMPIEEQIVLLNESMEFIKANNLYRQLKINLHCVDKETLEFISLALNIFDINNVPFEKLLSVKNGGTKKNRTKKGGMHNGLPPVPVGLVPAGPLVSAGLPVPSSGPQAQAFFSSLPAGVPAGHLVPASGHQAQAHQAFFSSLAAGVPALVPALGPVLGSAMVALSPAIAALSPTIQATPSYPVSDAARISLAVCALPVGDSRIVPMLALLESMVRSDENKSLTPLITARESAADALYGRNLINASATFSLLAPAGVVFFLNRVMNETAVASLEAVSTLTASATATIELTSRNIPAYFFSFLKSAVSKVPVSVGSVFSSVVSAGESVGATTFATESILGATVKNMGSAAVSASKDSILIGNLMLYIILSIILGIVSAVMIGLHRRGSISGYGTIGLFGIRFSFGGKRQTRRNRKK